MKVGAGCVLQSPASSVLLASVSAFLTCIKLEKSNEPKNDKKRHLLMAGDSEQETVSGRNKLLRLVLII